MYHKNVDPDLPLGIAVKIDSLVIGTDTLVIVWVLPAMGPTVWHGRRSPATEERTR